MTGAAKRLALATLAGVLGATLAGSAALAAFVPDRSSARSTVDPIASAATHAERDGPRDRLAEILERLVVERVLTEAQRDAILERVGAEHPEKRRPAHVWKQAFAGMFEAAIDFIGIERSEVRAALAEGDTLAEIADRADKDRKGLIAAMVADANDRIDAALDEGDLTEEQAADLRDRALAHAEKLADRVHEPKDGERRKPEFSRVNVHAFIGGYLKAAMTYLELTADELARELRAGNSLADLVPDDKTVEDLVEAIAAPADDKIDAAQGSGRLTEEQATELKERVREAVEKIVEMERRGKAPKVDVPKNGKNEDREAD